ncbi:MAG: hypothetical protein QXK24_06910 [Ignisphaera sp.]
MSVSNTIAIYPIIDSNILDTTTYIANEVEIFPSIDSTILETTPPIPPQPPLIIETIKMFSSLQLLSLTMMEIIRFINEMMLYIKKR